MKLDDRASVTTPAPAARPFASIGGRLASLRNAVPAFRNAVPSLRNAVPSLFQGSARGMEPDAPALSRSSLFIILAFGLTLLLIHLGDGRVLTRHEVLAAQPGREMLHDGGAKWLLPTLAGLPRTAKPPGMMWLIAASIAVFRDEAEWVARLPSALAALAVAVMMARLAARWFGDRVGRLAGLLQLSFVYVLTQAKLAEADMALTAAVCAALGAFAVGVIDSPRGIEDSRRARVFFWLAAAGSFLLKGPIGLVFIGLTVAAFAYFRARGNAGKHDDRVARFLLDPVGIGCFVVLVAGWPLLALYLDPAILRDWKSETGGTTTGKFGSGPVYYYLWSVPVMLLPWTPMVALGLWRGPGADAGRHPVRPADEWLRRNMTDAARREHHLKFKAEEDRSLLWRFLLCWLVPGLVYISFGIALKSHHYAFPLLPPLTIPAALGLAHYVRRQTSAWNPRLAVVSALFAAACAVAAALVFKLPQVPEPMRQPVALLIGLVALGGVIALFFEQACLPAALMATYFLTAWLVGVGVQAIVMPAQDDFKPQTDFARAVNGWVPPGATVYLLGHREEEQEGQYAYYLRFPIRRLTTADEFTAEVRKAGGTPTYAIAPAGMLGELKSAGPLQTLATCDGLRPRETESDRLQLLRVAVP